MNGLSPDFTQGTLFLDDGESLNTTENAQFSHITFQCSTTQEVGQFAATIDQNNFTPASTAVCISHNLSEALQLLNQISVLGVDFAVNMVILNGKAQQFSYTPETKTLIISDIGVSIVAPFNLTWG
jgi:hypothetical protein